MKLSDYVFRFVAGLGVKHVFMLPGGGAMHLVDSLGRNPDLEFVCNLHEQACAIAAEAYAGITNNFGVALVTSGPGGTNAITGVAAAWLDSLPCLFISGQVKRADLMTGLGVRQLGVQELDIVSIVKSITKYAVMITDPATIRYHLEKAAYLATSGRRGPVWLDIPLDVQAAIIDPDSLKRYRPEKSEALASDRDLRAKVSAAIDFLNKSSRPVILAGNGIRLAGAQSDFLRLAEALGVPVLTTWLGLDLIPDSHELLLGRPGGMAPRGANFALQNADWLLTIGAGLDMAMIGYAYDKLARAAKKIIIDIDPTEIEKVKTPVELPVAADAKAFIKEFIAQSGKVKKNGWPAWRERCRDWKSRYPVVLPEHRDQKENVSTYAFSEVLSEELSGDDVIMPGCSGNAVEILLPRFQGQARPTCVSCPGSGRHGLRPSRRDRRLPRERTETDHLRRRRWRLPVEYPGTRNPDPAQAPGQILRHQ